MGKVRVRCPVCGMLVWQKRLHRDYKFEFVIQESKGEGYRKLKHKYYPARVADSPGAKLFQLALGLKLIGKGCELVKETPWVVAVKTEDEDDRFVIVIEWREPSEEEARELAREAEEIKEEAKTPEYATYEMEVPFIASQEVEVPAVYGEDVKFSLVKRMERGSKKSKSMEEVREVFEACGVELEEVIEKEIDEVEMEVK